MRCVMSVPTTARSAKAQEFLDVLEQNPPKHGAAQGPYEKCVQVLKSLDQSDWDLFFALGREEKKPVQHVMKSEAIAAVNPADHAYCLHMRVIELDKSWWERHRKKFSQKKFFVVITFVGGAVTWTTQHGGWLWDNVIRPLLGLLSFLGFLIGFALLLLDPGSLAKLLRTAAAALERVAAALERVRSISRTETRSDTMSGTM
jgi:hypothetical protein